MTWRDIFPYFYESLDLRVYDDYRSIKPYKLKRSRVPKHIFKKIAQEIDLNRKIMGSRRELENEAAIQLYYHPIPMNLLSLFNGRLTNLPEHLLQGTISKSGRCEYTITFYGRLMLLFIEYKTSLEGNPDSHSDVVAQCIAEADGAATFNETRGFDGFPIHAILTDGRDFEFYHVDFSSYTATRGVPSVEAGITSLDPDRITLPHTERAPDWLPTLKVVIEVVFDTFLQSYISGIEAHQMFSRRRARVQQTELGIGYRRRRPVDTWDRVHHLASTALETFRDAHHARVVDTTDAEATAARGLAMLQQSADLIPDPQMDWSIIENWDEREQALLRV
jgi:hypothetical protein